MNKIYFGFGLSDSMFPDKNLKISRWTCTIEFVRGLVVENKIISCFNPSHKETLRVLGEKFKIFPQIPSEAPIIRLNHGDAVIVMGFSGLPRLEGRHEYTSEEIARATFRFAMYVMEN